MTPHQIVATSAWATLTLGVALWRRPPWSRRLVLAGMALDLGVVLHLQVTRDAVQQAMRFDRPWIEQAHIAVSTLAVAMYIPTLVFLRRCAREPGSPRDRIRYARTLWGAYGFRTLGFILMFTMAS